METDGVDDLGKAGKGAVVAHVAEVELRLVEPEVHLDAHQALGLAMHSELRIAAQCA